uniref:photosystem I assembly protein Ycf4 n=1 Tax=Rhodaphanes brevistipitata TaxID=446136 RepID=UPI001FCDCCEC|nr:photosystem I assembly protein Ycf4 [Rhodaphanes brevistipitata]UNJ18419.1 photosystem I assembly protein Ycf4 [Rhodaphanes brevistipitata]
MNYLVCNIYMIYKSTIQGSRRLSNYWWATVIFLGGVGFVLSGFSSYSKINLIPFARPIDLLFIPQGIIMTFYGTIGICIGIFLWLTIAWDIGSGYNEFNKENGNVCIFRRGFPGKNRQISLHYQLVEVQSVLILIRDGLNPQRQIYLKLKNGVEIPLTRVGQPISLAKIESQAIELAKFLGVILENKK